MSTTFGKDFLSSLVVFLVALPLCLGVAVASGMPPEAGLITGIIGGLLVGFLAGSPLQVSGPAAGLVVLVFELHQEHGMAALGVILMLAGLMQVAAGLLKTGQWFRAISPAVVYGMLAGIGVLIMAGQFHVAIDALPKASGIKNLIAIPEAILSGIFLQPNAALVALLTIGVMLAWNKFRPEGLKFLPGPLMGLLAAAIASYIGQLAIKYVHIPASLLPSLALPSLQALGGLSNPKYWTAAAAIAFIASAETLLSAAAVDKMTAAAGRRDVRTNYDRELMAQGAGNLLCGALGALPMTGVIVRSSANVQAGAQTRWSAIMHGGWLLMTVLLIPNVLEKIPTSALAAVLVMTGWKLINFEHVRKLRSFGWFPVIIYASTLTGVVAIDLLTGVVTGIALTMLKMMYKASQLDVRLVSNDVGQSDIYLEGSATFLRLPSLADALALVAPKSELHIHFDKLAYLDHSCLDLIQEWKKSHEDNGGKVVVEWEQLVQRFSSAKV